MAELRSWKMATLTSVELLCFHAAGVCAYVCVFMLSSCWTEVQIWINHSVERRCGTIACQTHRCVPLNSHFTSLFIAVQYNTMFSLIRLSCRLCPRIQCSSSLTTGQNHLGSVTFTETGTELDWSHAQPIPPLTECHCCHRRLQGISSQRTWMPNNFGCPQVIAVFLQWHWIFLHV